MQSPSATANGTHWDLAPVARELLAQTVGREGGLATIKLTLHLKKNGCSRNNISRSVFLWVFFGVPDGQLQLEPPAALTCCRWVLACQKDRLLTLGFSFQHVIGRVSIHPFIHFQNRNEAAQPCCQILLASPALRTACSAMAKKFPSVIIPQGLRQWKWKMNLTSTC